MPIYMHHNQLLFRSGELLLVEGKRLAYMMRGFDPDSLSTIDSGWMGVLGGPAGPRPPPLRRLQHRMAFSVCATAAPRSNMPRQ